MEVYFERFHERSESERISSLINCVTSAEAVEIAEYFVEENVSQDCRKAAENVMPF